MAAVENITYVGKRYILVERIGAGGMGIVHRAMDRLTNRIVALKQVTATSDQLLLVSNSDQRFDLRLALAHEFRLLASLRHPNIISVLDYGFDDQQQPFFTMDYLEQALTVVASGQQVSPEAKMGLIVQVLQALAYLHRRGILHRDLKPGNVLVTNNHVKVVDFGLATPRGQNNGTAGTLAYLAPELIQGEPSTELSDLYAVGVIAYELLSGSHPYNQDSLAELLDQIVHYTPDVYSLNLEPGLAAIIQRLLAKDPADRFPSVEAVLVAYNEIAKTPQPYDTAATRESFLQAAKFVGRANEIEQLSKGIQYTKVRQGSSWLIGGESGVGKSRLLDEIRAIALVEGAVVLRGHAISEGGSPYRLWSDIVRYLAMATHVTDLEASVLKLLVPDIDRLIERPVADAAELDAQAAQERLITSIEALFERYKEPLLVIIEDLQWAGKDSLDVLRRLNRAISAQPIMFIGSYRLEENPDLPAQFPDMHSIKLERFDETYIAELSESMLGPAGRTPEFVALLRQETEGNVYFVVETVRALSEMAGNLNNVALMTLPHTVFAGGIRIAVRRRLERIPAWGRHLLTLAAVSGRQLDLRLLADFDPSASLDNWLTVCADAAVLDVQNGNWQFAHDKLRESLLSDLPESARPEYHRTIATSIERVYPDSPDFSIKLAYHWRLAGNIEKDYYYSVQAGKYALERTSNEIAVDLLAHALDLNMADTMQQAELEAMLSEAHYGLGHVPPAIAFAESAITHLGGQIPKTAQQKNSALLGQLIRQMLHLALPGLLINRAPLNDRLGVKLVRLYESLSLFGYLGNDSVATILHAIYALNNAERMKPTPELARAYSIASVIAGLVNLDGLARRYKRRTFEVAEAISMPPQVMRIVLANVSVYLSGVGDWATTFEYLSKGVQIAQELGEWRAWSELAISFGMCSYLNGKLRDACTWSEELYTKAIPRGDAFMILTGLQTYTIAAIRLGENERVAQMLLRIEEMIPQVPNSANQLSAHAILALGYAQLGQQVLARKMADKALQFTKDRAVSYYLAATLVALAEVYLAWWEQGDSTAAAPAQQAVKALKSFTFRISHPAKLRTQAQVAWITGKPDRAISLWKKGIEAATALDEQYELGATHLILAQHLPAGEERRTHAKTASDLFARIGAAPALAAAKPLISAS